MSPFAVPGADSAAGSLLSALLNRILDRRAVEIPLDSAVAPITEINTSEAGSAGTLAFWIGPRDGLVPAPACKTGDSVAAGQPLVGESHPLRSPVAGKVMGVMSAPDVRGRKGGVHVSIEPDPEAADASFEPLDPAAAPVQLLRERIVEAGVMTAELLPRPVLEVLSSAPSTLVVLAADREPSLSGASQLLRDRTDDALIATELLARISGAQKATLAVLAPMVEPVRLAPKRKDVSILALTPTYPASLDSLVAARIGTATTVVALETALAVLDAIRDGRVPRHKVLTVIGPKKVHGNFRVPLGLRLKDLLAGVGLKVRERDKVVAGGPMRGFAQMSLDAAIDFGIDAVMVIRAAAVVPWSDEPCINCGACIDACPLNLQVQMLGRNAEFGLFEATRDLDLDACIECGLCAAVCTTRRPLLQLIRLAKHELEDAVTVVPATPSGETHSSESMEVAS